MLGKTVQPMIDTKVQTALPGRQNVALPHACGLCMCLHETPDGVGTDFALFVADGMVWWRNALNQRAAKAS